MLKYYILNDIVPRNGFGSHASRLLRVFHCRRKFHLNIHINVEVKVKIKIYIYVVVNLNIVC